MVTNTQYYRSSEPTEQISQGDVLRFTEPQAPGYDMCVVLNADCDLAKKKNQGCLVTLPIYTARQFYRSVLLPKRLDDKENNCIESIRCALMVAHSEEQSGAQKPSQQNVTELLQRSYSEFEDFACSLPNPHYKKIMKQRKIWEILKRDKSSNHKALFDVLKLENKSITTKSFIGIIYATLKKEPEDIIRLGPLEGSTEYLHLVYLRQTTIVLETDLTDFESPGGTSVGVAQRICSLTDPIRYLVAQRFGSFFSRVGVPEPLEEERDAAVDLLIEEISNELE